MSDQFAKTAAELIARIVSTQQIGYSGWVSAGTGAGFALLVGSADRVIGEVGLCWFNVAGALLIASFLAHAAARYLALGVAVAAEILGEMAKLDPGEKFDFDSFTDGMANRSLWPLSVIMRHTMRAGRDVSKLMLQTAQAQTIGIALQCALVVLAAGSLLVGAGTAA